VDNKPAFKVKSEMENWWVNDPPYEFKRRDFYV
jgi:hypothetical protein